MQVQLDSAPIKILREDPADISALLRQGDSTRTLSSDWHPAAGGATLLTTYALAGVEEGDNDFFCNTADGSGIAKRKVRPQASMRQRRRCTECPQYAMSGVDVLQHLTT